MYIFPHSELWKDDFENEAESIKLALGLDIELIHIGSTSVPGLLAKDCIDILGQVENLEPVRKARKKLEDIGFEARGSYGIEGREYFSKSSRKCHLHIFEFGSTEAAKHLGFKDVMLKNPELVEALNRLKTELHSKYPNHKEKYQAMKKPFYDRIHSSLKL
ncbi:GrpB family protein [Pseudoalteromonas sp. OOF1S-7]|uniref:GrpB family protein n=1 Tax=Pseudoalteromonas sp. OOF1S-7 TaxID=2917757 RepID=UPI001EF426E2|nr:GrpB family protein [Pseudoalteromonas sp. OOF1S-7]MCG7536587.1 GrpB family protein [Pseudoalteromonas sp. OOF1S-7]